MFGIDDDSSENEEIDFPESKIALNRKAILQKELEEQEKQKQLEQKGLDKQKKSTTTRRGIAQKEPPKEEPPKAESPQPKQQNDENNKDEKDKQTSVKQINNKGNSPKKHKQLISPEVREIFEKNLNIAPIYANKKDTKPKKSKYLISESNEKSSDSSENDEDIPPTPLKNKYIGLPDVKEVENEPMNKPKMSFRTDTAKRSPYLKTKKEKKTH